MAMPPIQPASEVADYWARWCGEDTQWVKRLREFGELGGLVRWWCGYPKSASAIPLAFVLFTPDGSELPGNSRLKDIRAAIDSLGEKP